MSPKLFVSDLDGTLLLPDKSLGQRTRSVLDQFIGAGGLFTVATGRCAASVAQILDGLHLPLPVITHNGALTVELDTEQICAITPLPREVSRHLFSQALTWELTPFAYLMNDEQRVLLLHGPMTNEGSRRYLRAMTPLLSCQEDRQGALLDRYSAVSFIFIDEHLQLEPFFAEERQRQTPLSTSLGRSAYSPELCVGEIQAKGATKAAAATRLARTLGLDVTDIVAFGDNMNDLPLLLSAGLSFCPPTAMPEVLAQVPQRIGCPAEEGVAAYLTQLLAATKG